MLLVTDLGLKAGDFELTESASRSLLLMKFDGGSG